MARDYPGPQRYTRELQIDGEHEWPELEWAFDRWDDSSWDHVFSWVGTLAEIGPSELTLQRFEDDGGQPAPEVEEQMVYRGKRYPMYVMRNRLVAVRR